MREHLNQNVKRREWYRPFGCSVLEAHASDWFETAAPSRYMLQIVRARPDRARQIPSAVHRDGTTRLHTVTRDAHPRLAELLSHLTSLGEPPLVLNTSFNQPGEPIVHTARHALATADASAVDAVMLGDRLLRREVRA